VLPFKALIQGAHSMFGILSVLKNMSKIKGLVRFRALKPFKMLTLQK
jgi:hypothetical protein